MIEEYKDKLPLSILDEAQKELKNYNLTKKQEKEFYDNLVEIYKESRISPGESIGVITAESFGEPSTQMSISYDEKIIIKINNKIKIVKIGEFLDKLMHINNSFKINDTEVLTLSNFEIYVPSLNQEEKIEWKKVVECSRHKYKKKLMKLTTASGREIIATDNHSFVIRKNNKIIPINGYNLNIGNRIPVIKSLLENCIEEINVSDYLIFKNTRFPLIEENYLLLRKKTLTKPIPNKIELDKNFGYFIGAYLAEGNATNGHISISNLSDSFMDNIKEFILSLGLDYVEEYHQRGFALSRDVKINSSLLANFIKIVCRTGSDKKFVPEFAYSAKEEFVSGLLRGYFDGDANFHVDRKMIRVSSNSKELIDGIALLLFRFKIFSYKIKDKKGQFWLLIPYKYAPLFLLYIGSNIEHKRRALEKLTEMSKKFWNNKSQDYTDMISGFDNIFVDVSQKLGLLTRYVNSATKRQKIGRTALYRHIKKFERLSKEKNIDISKELSIMIRMFNSDVIWDEIKKIEYVDYDKEYVYDLSVPGLETFTTFDGIITHNTLNIFHFAGVAELNVTLGLPRLIEIFDARKEASTPSMEIYLDKEYSRDINMAKKVAALIKETRFRELAQEFSINIAKLQIEVILNKKNMRDLRISDQVLLKTLADSIKDITVKQNKDGTIILKPEKEIELKDLYRLKEKAKDTFIKGISRITQVLPIKQNNEFVILTSGSNLKEVFKFKEVDKSRSISNDIFEVLNILGIEAARQVIINEALKVIQEQGLDVDIRHIMFIADLMTTAGTIRGITRSGITSEKESVLARASFETPIKHIIDASLLGEEDELNSVIENVIVNQPVPLGTGLPGLIAKIKKVESK